MSLIERIKSFFAAAHDKKDDCCAHTGAHEMSSDECCKSYKEDGECESCNCKHTKN